MNTSTAICQTPECGNSVSKPWHPLCYSCWKKSQAPSQKRENYLTAARISKEVGLKSPQHVNRILSELGWLTRDAEGWTAIGYGTAIGAKQHEDPKTGVPYVKWPRALLKHEIFLNAVREFSGETSHSVALSKADSNFRKKFPAEHRAQDGHMVRSKAEMLIDNWLYITRIVHAYERRLPVEEEAYCDFYIPEGKVYIEYWGLENDPQYRNRKETKLEIYRRHGLDLIELNDEQVKNLDDHLPRELLKRNITVD